MIGINRSVIGKAIFGISVVAITATAGVAGFASAARHHPDRDGDGYGGYGGNAALIQAAVNTFNAAVAGATTKLQTDINQCVANAGRSTRDADDFRRDSRNASSNFSARTDDPTAFSNANQFNNAVASADNRLGRDVDADMGNLTANLDRNIGGNDGRRNSLSKCTQTADRSFRTAVRNAETTLKNTLRNIFA
jgi:hypothetical protein